MVATGSVVPEPSARICRRTGTSRGTSACFARMSSSDVSAAMALRLRARAERGDGRDGPVDFTAQVDGHDVHTLRHLSIGLEINLRPSEASVLDALRVRP